MKSLSAWILLLAPLAGALRAQDPALVSPDHYKVEIENDYVRVLRSTGPGHARTPMHSHPPNVVVYLSDADARVVGPDGVAKDSHRKRGEAIWNDAQQHERINLSDRPYELIQVELKQAHPPIMRVPPALDATKVTPDRYTVLVENDRVRVLRARIGPRAKAPLHAHPPYVAVALSESHQRLTSESGETRESKRPAGSLAFNPALRHAEENLLDTSIDYILVELK